uniref:ATP synthase CF1 epsilon subunit n=2 Tax=Gracilariopsis TaxID=2781 RepID=A0A1C9CEQ5_9FLOR|nr:ATP synthase epsilon chain [Gracilariopsis lemaneiformis]YP_009294628.1 ATP synthase CF1 epsilon subunit [Gracilariopsis chorda]AJO68469.1 ATP synthase CF1 epsilon subunit [Gracilariopsis lemaneiformis]AML79782.1 ATP synthase epsilon chain [Gracilariopsis lemaneiformis]AOM66888.1 ATP synthase CF1 epsilon subunit [Gracilariopsis chorda]UAD88851.1 ATP synthase CF1 subunit epsilon [Gracilariopsis chorda]
MTLNIRIIAPDRTVWDANAQEVILPSSTGQLGILKGHIPLLTAIDIGVMRVRIDKEWQPIILLGGFAEVKDNNITILVNGAEEISNIDINTAQANLEEATKFLEEAQTDKDKIEAAQNLRKARAKIQAANVLNS